MPTNRTRRVRTGRVDLDGYRQEELLFGPGTALIAGTGYLAQIANGEAAWSNTWEAASDADRAAVLADMAADWRRHGDALLAWWIDPEESEIRRAKFVMRNDPGGPGTRPWAWWRFTAPEPRRPGEEEAAYLIRRRLLLRGERELI